jgi:hypothetical protein
MVTKMDDVTEAMIAGAGAKAAWGYGGVKATSIVTGAAAVVSALFVMILLEPQSKMEKFVCLVSTLICAACLSSAITIYFGIVFPDNLDGHLAKTGLIIASGAPGWAAVRAFVLTAAACKNKDIGQIIKMVRGWFGK